MNKIATILLLIMCLTLVICQTAFAERVPLPKTGQTTSYAAGDDGATQRGIAWSNPRFTDNNDGTVMDNLTGLIWLKNANCFGSQTWFAALTSANNLANGTCSLSDGSVAGQWRLPSINELASLVDITHTAPSLPSGHPFTSVQTSGSVYWSSTSNNVYATGNAWFVNMDSGDVNDTGKGGSTNKYILPVRSGW